VVAYADDIVLVVSGKFPCTLRDIMQLSLAKVKKWAISRGLGVNPSKTEVVLFTRKHRIPSIPPLTLDREPIALKSEAQFLGVILDRKLNWKPNIIQRAKKASVALYSCKRALGKKWGLKPIMMYWIYTAVVRPILTYGSLVWWKSLEKDTHHTPLRKIQRSACIAITGALRTTPTSALEVLLHLIPLDLHCKQTAAITSYRLRASQQWSHSNIGHARINNLIETTKELDYTVSQLHFNQKFTTSIPERSAWECDIPSEIRNMCHIFTDGSKLDIAVGAGVFSESPNLNLNLALRLPDHCSVFQAEVSAIEALLRHEGELDLPEQAICILSDSSAAISALKSHTLNSKTVINCLGTLKELTERHSIHLMWVPGHSNIEGNCKADELARTGPVTELSPELASLGMPISTCRLTAKEAMIRAANCAWATSETGRIAYQIWPKLDWNRTKSLLSLNRGRLSVIVGVITGHCILGAHAKKIGLGHLTNDFCRSCRDEEEEETIIHLLCTCPALSRNRKKHLGFYNSNYLSDIAKVGIRQLSSYVGSSGWFTS